MKTGTKRILLALGSVVGIALAMPGLVHADEGGTCQAASECTLKNFAIGGPWFADMVVDNGPHGGKIAWLVVDGYHNFLCSGEQDLDQNGHLAASFPCPDGVGPYQFSGASHPNLMDWHLGHHI
ncbi:hypothetical protein ACQPXH_26510 [Nocardia sp. CA-135953]|uniref:hypothetical protein n=1 Tax=Nocardia sp. CA-135953 TaxID=3239978 RepID=UPI003D966899